MRIAIILRRLTVRGGRERQALSLARELKKRGESVTLYAFEVDQEACFPDLLKDQTIVVLPNLSKKKGGGFLAEIFNERRNAKALAKLIHKETDILNPHDQGAFLVACYFKKFKNVPSVWMMNDMPTRFRTYWRDKQLQPGLKVSLLKRLLYRLSDALFVVPFARLQNMIVVLDRWNKNFVEEEFKREAVVIRSGIDHQQFSFREHSFPQGEIKLLTNGIFLRHRRFEDIIEAVFLLKQEKVPAKLSIVGDYHNDQKYNAMLKQLIKDRGLEHDVVFTGKVSEAELLRGYETHDIFVFANWLQTWGLAPFEAMSSGLPTIISRGCGAHEVVEDGRDALLVSPKSPEEIKKAVLHLKTNPEHYVRLSHDGRAFVEKNLSWEKYAHDMHTIFMNLIQKTNV